MSFPTVSWGCWLGLWGFLQIAQNIAFLSATREIVFIQTGQPAMGKAQTNLLFRFRAPAMSVRGAFSGEARAFLPSVQTEEIQLYSLEHEISVKKNVASIEKSLLFFH